MCLEQLSFLKLKTGYCRLELATRLLSTEDSENEGLTFKNFYCSSRKYRLNNLEQ